MTYYYQEVLVYTRGASVTITEFDKVAPGVYRGSTGVLFDLDDSEVYRTPAEARIAGRILMAEMRRQIDRYLEEN